MIRHILACSMLITFSFQTYALDNRADRLEARRELRKSRVKARIKAHKYKRKLERKRQEIREDLTRKKPPMKKERGFASQNKDDSL